MKTESPQPKSIGMTRMVSVEVTQADIDHGKRDACWRCPVALAIARASGCEAAEVHFDTSTFDGEEYHLPKTAIEFITRFDRGEPVSPFTFELPAPDAENETRGK